MDFLDWTDELPVKDMPNVNDPVYVDGQLPQPNGYVARVNTMDGLVMVKFYDDDGSWEWYDLDCFRGTHNPRFCREKGGQWFPSVNF
jgi:hypothetical protein